MENKEKTYHWYANQLNISVRTAKRRGKSELERLLKSRSSGVQSPIGPSRFVPDCSSTSENQRERIESGKPPVGSLEQLDELADVLSLDTNSKMDASFVLNQSLKWIINWLNTENSQSMDNYKAQIIVSLMKAIVASK